MKIQNFDYFINVAISLLWQYNEATSLQSLVLDKQEWINENNNEFWINWHDNVFNLQTANDFGLSVWSIILNLPLFIPILPDSPDKPIWGFGQYRKNFNNGNFARTQGNIVLNIEERRLCLKLRYFQFVNRGSSLEINKFLYFSFSAAGLGQIYVLDGLDMTITYVFKFKPSYSLLSALIE